ncbi:Holliday junction branch migration protein RuvA [Streptomyces caniscabiei]|uniref:Holliday junction branch migration protein RuvA n=1 Tax=Streptomyces caniscabiei TaxID=2746961 RepID=UPI0029ACFAC3|nr:Holliday junction branch migration protein RuvA [Streptomyces caniscabiei]MDX2776544.1 Holliday junction branch migration protein RuvA [Streptomyces caniscabiei]
MIAHVSGIVAEKFNSSIIVDVQGVGYEVAVAAGDYEQALLNEPVKFYTYHHIREQSQELFGFTSLAAKKLFELLITVQGVGPKAALAILSLDDSEVVRNAIANGDAAFITKASGVGKRIAERVVVDLTDKVGLAIRTDVTPTGVSQQLSHTDEALEALMALGYSLNDATRALEGIPMDLSTADRVTQALKG